jgi:hypothetical protein
MKYADPHHKRTDFEAESFASDSEGANHRIAFVGHGQHQSVELVERGEKIVAIIPETEYEFVLWKAQILEKQKWLTLDFENNPLLSRILVHIDLIDFDSVDAALRSLIGTRSLIYYRH